MEKHERTKFEEIFLEKKTETKSFKMSWKGFQKAMARLPQVISKSTGMSEETSDPEFLDLEDKFKGLEACVKKLHEDSRKFRDSLSEMLLHQKVFAENLLYVYQPISSLKSGRTGSQVDLVRLHFT